MKLMSYAKMAEAMREQAQRIEQLEELNRQYVLNIKAQEDMLDSMNKKLKRAEHKLTDIKDFVNTH